MNRESPRSRLVLVRNRAGVRLPLSAEWLATSMLAAGVSATDAFALAGRLDEQLRRHYAPELCSSRLAERIAGLLETEVDAAAAERFAAWRRYRRAGRPFVLCLLGASGVGKSTTANALAQALGVQRIVHSDSLREVLRTTVPESVLPELHLPAHATVNLQAELPTAGFRRQANAVGGAAAAVAEQMVAEGHSVMLVGAHLMPGDVATALAQRGCGVDVIEVLLTLEDEELHRSTMLRRTRSDPTGLGARRLISFDAVRAVQQELMRVARQNGVRSHDRGDAAGLTGWIVDRLTAGAAAVRAG